MRLNPRAKFYGVLLLISILTTQCRTELNNTSSGKIPCEISELELFSDGNATEVYADCSNRNLTAVPIELPFNITCLNLVGNQIVTLSGTVWKQYPYLKKLSLANNYLEDLKKFYFGNLLRLEQLDLSLNRIRYTSIDQDSFQELGSLTFLDLKQRLPNIWPNESYPKALQNVSNLKTLAIDGLDDSFPFSLPNLKEIYLSGNYGRCVINLINKETFHRLNYLENLFISNCSIQIVEFDAFVPLTKLVSLDISWNGKLEMKSLANITSGLRNSRVFKRLNINSLYNYTTFDSCASLRAEDIRYLNSTSVELLLVENNNLIRIDENAVRWLPMTLKYVSVHHNMFVYGPYLASLNASQLPRNLLYYDTSHMVAANQLLDDDWSSRADLPPLSESQSMFTRLLVGDYFTVIDYRLKKYNITNSKQFVKLQYLDLSKNIPEMINRTLEIFDININVMDIKFLNLSQNFLGYPLYDSETFFRNLPSLRTLDLRDNGIIKVHPAVFSSLESLETLILSFNKLSSISFSLQYMPNLKFLDLSSNSFEYISEAARNEMDKHDKLQINIQGNLLKCSCDKENLDFIKWIKTTRIKIENLHETFCFQSENSTNSLAEIDYNILHSKCFPPTYFALILSSSLMIAISVLVVIAGIAYRYRWDIRYLYHVVKLNFRASGYRILDSTDFFRDVFVSYAEEDRIFVCEQILTELEKKSNISLLLHDRDFWPGEWVSDNIIRAIRNTRKTLVVLTNEYISREWCRFEMNMARQEAVYTNRNILCVILKEEIRLNESDLPLEIIEVLRNQTYIEFPTNEANLPTFWSRLKFALSESS